MKKVVVVVILTAIVLSISSCSVIKVPNINEDFYNTVHASEGEPLEAKVQIFNGIPKLCINGTPVTSVAFFGNMDYGTNVTEQVELAADNDIHLHSTIAYIGNPGNSMTSVTSRLDAIIKGDPEAKIILRIDVGYYDSKDGWEDEFEKKTNGENTRYISFGSDRWAEEVQIRLKEIVEYLRSDPKYADHVAVIHLDRYEWRWGAEPDISQANQNKFREWLKEKYGTDEELMNAWGVDYGIDDVEIPTNFKAVYPSSFYSRPEEQIMVDYQEYAGNITARRIEQFSKAIKEASDNNLVVIAFYGYYYELGNTLSGHYDLQTLLKSPYIDGFCAPVSYSTRTLVSSSAYMTAVDSIIRNGKLWFQESDQRTSLNFTDRPDITGGVIGGVDEIILKHKWEMGMNLVHSNGTWVMDLMGMGWYRDEKIWENMSELDKMYRSYSSAQQNLSRFDVLVVFDESAMSIERINYSIADYTLSNVKDAAYTQGMSVGFAEMQDVIDGKFNDSKIYLFLNPFGLTEEDADKLSQNLHDNDKMLIFQTGFGNLDPESVEKLTGMQTEYREDEKVLSFKPYGKYYDYFNTYLKLDYRYNGKTVIKSGYDEVLGYYGTSDDVAFAIKDCGDFRTVIFAASAIDFNYIRNFAELYNSYEKSKINIFTDTKDIFVANENLIIMQSAQSGQKTITFTEPTDVYDWFENKWYENITEFTFDLSYGNVKWFLYGHKTELLPYVQNSERNQEYITN